MNPLVWTIVTSADLVQLGPEVIEALWPLFYIMDREGTVQGAICSMLQHHRKCNQWLPYGRGKVSHKVSVSSGLLLRPCNFNKLCPVWCGLNLLVLTHWGLKSPHTNTYSQSTDESCTVWVYLYWMVQYSKFNIFMAKLEVIRKEEIYCTVLITILLQFEWH